MIYVALASLAIVGLTVVAFVGLIRALVRTFERRADLLLNQLLNVVGKPWQLPPPVDFEASLRATADTGELEDELEIEDELPV